MAHHAIFSAKTRKAKRVELSADEIAAREAARVVSPDMVDDYREQLLASGIVHNGVHFQTDQRSRAAIAEKAAAAARSMLLDRDGRRGIRWMSKGRDFEWIATDNSRVKMSAKQMTEFGDAVAAYEDDLRIAARDLKDTDAIPLDFMNPKYWPTAARAYQPPIEESTP